MPVERLGFWRWGAVGDARESVRHRRWGSPGVGSCRRWGLRSPGRCFGPSKGVGYVSLPFSPLVPPSVRSASEGTQHAQDYATSSEDDMNRSLLFLVLTASLSLVIRRFELRLARADG